MLPQDAPDYKPHITDEDWFLEYMEAYLLTLNEDVRENWENISKMSTAEILQLIGDCGNSGTATALNTPFDAEAWRTAAEAANRMAILAFYVELRYRAVENNLRGMVIEDGSIQNEKTDSSSRNESAGVEESTSPRDRKVEESTEGDGASVQGIDRASGEEPPSAERRTGLTEVPQTSAR